MSRKSKGEQQCRLPEEQAHDDRVAPIVRKQRAPSSNGLSCRLHRTENYKTRVVSFSSPRKEILPVLFVVEVFRTGASLDSGRAPSGRSSRNKKQERVEDRHYKGLRYICRAVLGEVRIRSDGLLGFV